MRRSIKDKILLALRIDRAVRLVWQAGPGWCLANFSLQIIQGILPLAALYPIRLQTLWDTKKSLIKRHSGVEFNPKECELCQRMELQNLSFVKSVAKPARNVSQKKTELFLKDSVVESNPALCQREGINPNLY